MVSLDLTKFLCLFRVQKPCTLEGEKPLGASLVSRIFERYKSETLSCVWFKFLVQKFKRFTLYLLIKVCKSLSSFDLSFALFRLDFVYVLDLGVMGDLCACLCV